MVATTALAWMSSIAAGWPPVATAFLINFCSGCTSLEDAGDCAATTVNGSALTIDDHARASRIGNTDSSRHSHRRVFERLRSLREPVLRVDARSEPARGLAITPVNSESGPSMLN